jgi:hypothetical protein
LSKTSRRCPRYLQTTQILVDQLKSKLAHIIHVFSLERSDMAFWRTDWHMLHGFPISFKLQFLHILSSLVIFLYLPDSISKLWPLTLINFVKQSTELQKWGPCRSKVWHVKNVMLVNRIYFVYSILWSNCNFQCFICFVCLYLYLYLLDPPADIRLHLQHQWMAKHNFDWFTVSKIIM